MEETESYRPGICNIGMQEINIRKKLFGFALLFSLVLTCMSFCCYSRPWILTLLFGSVFFTILLFIEIRYRFCVLFGFFTLYNFRQPGRLENVENRQDGRRDRRRALKLISFSSLAAGLLTYLDYLLVSYIYF